MLVCFFAFTCNAARAESSSVTDSSKENISTSEFSFEKIGQMTDEEAIKTYCKAVFDRSYTWARYGHYLTADEYNYLVANGFKVDAFNDNHISRYDDKYGFDTYHMPVIFEGENGIELWYIAGDGELWAIAVEGRLTNDYSWDIFGDVHYTESSDETVLQDCLFYKTVYNAADGTVSVWEFGAKTREHSVPENSIYAGFSGKEGFIFRSGSDVYAVRDYGCSTRDYGVCVIAHNVEFVIDADYEAGNPDEFSQPLFLMKDGTIKCYCTFYSDEGTPVDDESNLFDVRFEGGFNI